MCSCWPPRAVRYLGTLKLCLGEGPSRRRAVPEGLYRQFVSLVRHELGKFGTIGAAAFVIDTGIYNLFLLVTWAR